MFLAASVSALPAAAFAEDDHGEHDPGEHVEHQDHGGDDGHDPGEGRRPPAFNTGQSETHLRNGKPPGRPRRRLISHINFFR